MCFFANIRFSCDSGVSLPLSSCLHFTASSFSLVKMTQQKANNISSIPIDAFSNLRITSIWTFLMSVSLKRLTRCANQLRVSCHSQQNLSNHSYTRGAAMLRFSHDSCPSCVCFCFDSSQVQWSEPWLIGLLVFHVVCLCLTVVTCRYYRAQICHFLLMGKRENYNNE